MSENKDLSDLCNCQNTIGPYESFLKALSRKKGHYLKIHNTQVIQNAIIRFESHESTECLDSDLHLFPLTQILIELLVLSEG